MLFLVLHASMSLAQACLNSPYGVDIGEDGIVTYSRDHVTYTLDHSDKSAFSAGVRSSLEIYPVGMGEGPVNMMLEVYPEPTSKFLMLTSSDELRENMFYEVYDAMGQLISKNELMGIQTEIDMTSMIPSTYFIRVTNGAMGEKVFKVEIS